MYERHDANRVPHALVEFVIMDIFYDATATPLHSHRDSNIRILPNCRITCLTYKKFLFILIPYVGSDFEDFKLNFDPFYTLSLASTESRLRALRFHVRRETVRHPQTLRFKDARTKGTFVKIDRLVICLIPENSLKIFD